MTRQLAISVRRDHTLIGLFEDQKLVDLFLDRPDQESAVGNIYVGRVVRVLNNIQAAFIDIGLPKDGFLAGDDALPYPHAPAKARHGALGDMIKTGQIIPVQVEKDEISDKGKKLTMDLSIPGRYLVYFPYQKHKINISKRVEDRKERKRLRDLLTEVKGSDQGAWIVRTVAEGATKKDLQYDARNLLSVWKETAARIEKAAEPILIHRELTPIEQVLRDHYSDDFDRILIDNLRAKQHIDRFIRSLQPKRLIPRRVTEYMEPDELLTTFGFKKELERAMSRKVWLDCGGYLIIEETETLTAIDVNTGKNVKGGSGMEAITRTNLEAAEEIGRQIRLRGIGGIIVVDFIDMKSSKDIQKVVSNLHRSLSKDKTAFDITPFSEIGLVQITRKRTGESLITLLSEDCPHCNGNGRILTLRG
ncbi:MAG: Rne/Rng family ribonuclease [Candidatus Omnitrophica bacterium]|nr:Rne/Rng family ribonuclease [Candidatus Omnitrophota bacterium]MBV6481127.1 Ribonuclease G [bacterium]MCE7907305.1 Rne/Rng family ribonuclease [Candidatus Omnitrophica bacterium COP1]MCL4734123.1 Rne/Rng family ribonuclease [Candidatus Omnitrophota bacterium]